MLNINIYADIYASRKYKLKAMHRWNNNYIEKNAIKKRYTENYASTLCSESIRVNLSNGHQAMAMHIVLPLGDDHVHSANIWTFFWSYFLITFDLMAFKIKYSYFLFLPNFDRK